MKDTGFTHGVVGSQRGIALVSALLLLLIVSLMAVGISMDTSMDVRIAGYQRFKARSFGFAESAVVAATDILEDNIHEAGWSTAVPFIYPNISADYDSGNGGTIQIMNDGVFYMDANELENTVLRMTGDIAATVVTQRLVTKKSKGGALQMAAGYAGLGKGAGAGGAHIIYNIMATGSDSDQSRTDLALHFRHVTK